MWNVMQNSIATSSFSNLRKMLRINEFHRQLPEDLLSPLKQHSCGWNILPVFKKNYKKNTKYRSQEIKRKLFTWDTFPAPANTNVSGPIDCGSIPREI